MTRPVRIGFRAIFGFLALFLAYVVFSAMTGLGDPDMTADLTAPQEDLCPQGAVLVKARLLERAQTLYVKAAAEEDPCEAERANSDPPLEESEAQIARAERSVLRASARSSAGLYGAAARSYTDALSVYPFNGAARLGLAELLAKPATKLEYCRLGIALTEAGVLGQAQAAIRKGLAEPADDPVENADLCRQGLDMLGERSAEAVAELNAATVSARKDEDSEARDHYASALAANAELTEARTELEGSIDEESRYEAIGSWLSGVPATLKDALSWALPLAIGLLGLTVLLWIVVREGSARIVWMRWLFEGVGKYSVFFHDAAVPEVSIEPFEGGDSSGNQAKELTNLLVAAMAEESRRRGSFPFDRLNKGSTEDSRFTTVVADALGQTTETKLLGDLIKVVSRLFRRRSIVLRGRLLPAGDNGVGILLTVEGNGRKISDEATLWERWFDPQPEGDDSVRYRRMVPAAKVWSRQKLAAAYELPRQADPTEWLPDALFQSAVAWQARRDFERAEALYVMALEKDPDLLPAAHNLATVEMHCKEFASAEARLRMLRKRLKQMRRAGVRKPRGRLAQMLKPAQGKGGDRAKLWPVLGTASHYSLILAIAYQEVSREAGPSERLEKAVEMSGKLIRKLAGLVEQPEDEFLTGENIRELEAAELPSLIVRASLLVRQFPEKRADAAARALAEKSAKPIGRKKLIARLGELEPWQLVDYVRSREEVVSRRTHYNLACYYTTVGTYAGSDRDRCFELALTELKMALVGGELRQWAALDPALTPLKRFKRAAFAEALKAHTIKKQEDADGGKEKKEEKPKQPDPEPKCAVKPAKAGIVTWLGERVKRLGEKIVG